MAGPLYFDRVMETSTTTGTGTYTLAGAVTGYQTFAVVGNSNTCYYCAMEVDGNGNPSGGWEVGLGTYTASGTTLTRTSVLASSNSNNPVNWGAGTRRIFLTLPATRVVKTGTYTFAMGDNPGTGPGLDPADATTYIFGDRPGFEAAAVSETLRVTMPKAGTAKVCHGVFVVLGTLATGESSTLTLHNRTAVTSQVISSSVLHNAARTLFNNTALTLAFSAGDELDISWLTPTWATNPTDVIARLDLYVEFTD